MNILPWAAGAVAPGSTWSWPLLFAAGVASSLGPCASPRLVALSALIVRSASPVVVGAAFIGSTVATYACFGLIGAVVADLVGFASWLYAGIALVALAGGGVTVIGAAPHHHEQPTLVPARSALSAAFLGGVGFALMVSPCCTPILGLIIAATSLHGNVLLGSGLLAIFGLGHAAPLVVLVAGGRAVVARLWSSRWSQGVQVGAGTCMMALGAYYALLV